MTHSKAHIKPYEKGSREEEAELSLKHTVLTGRMAWTLCLLFLATIFLEPALQHAVEIRAGLAARRQVAAGITQGHARLLPQVYDVFRLLPSWRAIRLSRTPQDGWNLLPPVKAIKAFETALEERSATSRFLLPRAQYLLCRFGGVGNEKVYCGRGHWLFYRPGIDYLTEEGFLSPAALRHRSRSGSEAIQPDPRKAILHFRDQLGQRGIRLIVMPVPSKAMIDPERFSRRYADQATPLQNPSFAQFKAELESAGLLVLDIAPALAERKQATGFPQFLETDTHWRPDAMEQAAGLLRDFVARHVTLPEAAPPDCKRVTENVSNLGDIAVMLGLSGGQDLYPRQTVTIHPVLNARGELWQASRSADVLLLGDSYSNIYSLDAMGWGYSAGFAEQASFALRRPLDRIVRNDAGAYATRQMLAQELARGRDRLAGKRLVIWEFAVRELAVGDWRLLDMKSPEEVESIRAKATRDRSFFVAPAGRAALVRGTVESISPAPRPGSVPYKDHILSIHLTELQGVESPVSGRQAVVYMWSMRDRKLLPAAHCRPGDRLALRLQPWAEVAAKYEAINRSELNDEELQLQEPNWGEEVKQ